MKKMFLTATAVTLLSVLIGLISAVQAASAPRIGEPVPLVSLAAFEAKTPAYVLPQVYKHGDCSWIPSVAVAAGWEQHQIPRLMHIIARESGCCPDRIGGSVVDANCGFIKMATMSHPSDSGLLQLNGINFNPKRNKYAPICTQMKICTQEPLLDAFTNLKAGRLLFEVTGSDWSPWIIPEGGW
jgi:hypothetical protein